jgi:hypothetical protein
LPLNAARRKLGDLTHLINEVTRTMSLNLSRWYFRTLAILMIPLLLVVSVGGSQAARAAGLEDKNPEAAIPILESFLEGYFRRKDYLSTQPGLARLGR